MLNFLLSKRYIALLLIVNKRRKMRRRWDSWFVCRSREEE
jgi:hypothetical protein